MDNELIKVSEFLDKLDSHSILDSAAIKKAFKDETGIEPEWHDYSKNKMSQRINGRGKGGELWGDASAHWTLQNGAPDCF